MVVLSLTEKLEELYRGQTLKLLLEGALLSMPIIRLLIRIPTTLAQREAVVGSLSTFYAGICTAALPKAVKMNSTVLTHTSLRAVFCGARSEPLASVFTYPHFDGTIPCVMDISKRV